jgi:hypothetical protein
MPLRNMKPQELLAAAQHVVEHEHMPDDCELIKNQVGNLAIVDAEDYQIGYIDLRWGEVVCYECTDTEGDPANALFLGGR